MRFSPSKETFFSKPRAWSRRFISRYKGNHPSVQCFLLVSISFFIGLFPCKVQRGAFCQPTLVCSFSDGRHKTHPQAKSTEQGIFIFVFNSIDTFKIFFHFYSPIHITCFREIYNFSRLHLAVAVITIIVNFLSFSKIFNHMMLIENIITENKMQ